MEVEFMTADTTLPPCMPLPRAMLRLPISSTAKVMYARMLDIVFVSGIQTNIGNLNRDIKAANSLMQSIRQMVRSLKGWLSGLKEKKAALLEALEQAKEPTIPELLSRYLDKRSEERTGWTSKGKLKGTVGDFNKVNQSGACHFPRENDRRFSYFQEDLPIECI